MVGWWRAEPPKDSEKMTSLDDATRLIYLVVGV